MSDDSKLRQIEQELKLKLYEITESIKKVMQTDIGNTPPTFAYETETAAIIRSFTQKAYMLGVDHATNSMKHEGYLTHSDIDAIGQIVRDSITRFWARVNKGIVVKQRQYEALKFTEADLTGHLSNAWIVDSLVTSVIYGAYNLAVKTKASKIIP